MHHHNNNSDVDFKDGDFQFGRTPTYDPQDRTKVADWWWDWAVQRGSNGNIYYGTMMVEFNERESISFGFSSTQDYYAITGGYLEDNACPNGYVRFAYEADDRDWRVYTLYTCGGC